MEQCSLASPGKRVSATLRRHWMPALVLIGYWALFTGLIFIALQYLPRKPRQLCCGVAGPVVTAMVAACWQQTHPAAVIHLV